MSWLPRVRLSRQNRSRKQHPKLQQQRDKQAHSRHAVRWLLGIEKLEDRALMAGLEDPQAVVQPVSIPLQPVGVPFVDSTFGTALRRVSNTSDFGSYETQVYSQLQAFSADNQLMLLVGPEGYRIRDVQNLSLVTSPNWNWTAPRWHPTLHHTIVDYGTNASGQVTVRYHQIDTGTSTTIFTFPSHYARIATNESFEDLSLDGRWMGGMLYRQDGQPVIFALDLQNQRLGAELNLHAQYATRCQPDPEWGEVTPNWVGISPLGRTLIAAFNRDGTAACSGIESYDLQTGAFVGRAHDGHQHGDLAVMADGVSETYAVFNIYVGPGVTLQAVPGTNTTSPPNLIRPLDWGNMEHISGRGPNGELLVTAGMDRSNGWTTFEGEVFVQHTDGSVERLAHHRSTSSGYWVQPRASFSRDGRYAIFASDWGRNTDGRGDPYLIDLGTSTNPPPQPNSPPVLDPLANQTVLAGSTLTFLASATDPDGDPLTFSLTANAPAGATINPSTGEFTWTTTTTQGPATYQVTIRVTDDGNPARIDEESFTISVLAMPSLSISDATLTEGDSGTQLMTFIVSLNTPSDRPISARYATASGSAISGSDFSARSGIVRFLPGETQKVITVPIIGDRRDEPDETFTMQLSQAVDAVFADATAVGTILDNDPASAISVANISVTEGDAGSLVANLLVRLNKASGWTVTVDYSTTEGTASAGNDYIHTQGTLTFHPGETSKIVPITILGDVLDEANETLFLQLANATYATLGKSQARITISDNDPLPTLSVDSVTILEGESGMQDLVFTVRLSSASGRRVSVYYATADGTACAGSDYRAARGTLSFEAGETTKTIRITVFGDLLNESTESFFLQLSQPVSATLATASGIGTILTDDQPTT